MARGHADHKRMPPEVQRAIKTFKTAPFLAFLPSYLADVRIIDNYYFDVISRLKKYHEDCVKACDCDNPKQGLVDFLMSTPEFIASQSLSTGTPRHWNPYQERIIFSTAIDRFLYGGNRVGKSVVGGVEDVAIAFGEHPNPKRELVERPGRVWACAPDLKAAGRDGIIKMLRWAAGKLGKWKEAQSRFEVVSKWSDSEKGEITFKSYDSGPEKFGSADCDLIHYDEPPPRSIYDECIMRLGEGKTHHLFTMTLVGTNSHWIVRDLYRQWIDDGRPDDPLWVNAGLRDNPHIDRDEIDRVEKKLAHDPDQLKVRVYGEMPQMGGFLYPNLDSDTHLVDDFEIPGVHRDPKDGEKPWTLYRCIDPGIRNPCYVGWVAVSPNDLAFIYRELCEADMSIPEICKWMLQHEYKREIFQWGTIDIAARQRDYGSGDTRTQIFAKNGVYLLEASNREVDTAVGTMREAFDYAKDDDGNFRREPRLRIFRSCLKTWKSLRNAAWKPKSSRTEEDPKEQALKKDADPENAIRYLFTNFGGPHYYPRKQEDTALVSGAWEPDQKTGY